MCHEETYIVEMCIWCIKVGSCEIVALRENFVDRPESYNSFSAKSCIFLAHEKTRTVWDIFPTNQVPSPILQIPDIVQSSLESPTLKFALIFDHVAEGSKTVRLVMVRK
jgi:hypothetical protein